LYYIFGVNALIGKIFNVLLVFVQFLALDKIINIFGVGENKKFKHWYLFFFLYPNLYFMNLLTLTEPLFLTFVMLSFLMFIKIIKYNRKNITNYILSGVFIALAILTRPIALLIPIFMIVFFIIKKSKAKNIITYILVFFIIVFSYGLLHKQKIGKINSWGTTSGINLFREYNDYGTGRHNQKSLDYIFSFDTSDLNAFEKNKFYTEKAVNWMKQNPGKTIIITIKKAVYLFLYDGVQIETAFNKHNAIDDYSLNAVISKFTKGFVSWIILLNQIFYGLLLLLAIRGIYYLIRLRKYENLILLISVPLLLFLVTLSGSGSNRYHFVIIMSAFPLIALGLEKGTKREFQ
jgi:hypothetical protein